MSLYCFSWATWTFLLASCSALLGVSLLLSLEGLLLFEVTLWESASHPVALTLTLDFISGSMLITVLWISTSVFLFSFSYLKGVNFYKSFHLTLALFVASMGALVLSPNLVTMMIGWDGLGLSSFLLVMFFCNPKSLNASLITFFSNRVGDGLLLVIMVFSLFSPSTCFLFWWSFFSDSSSATPQWWAQVLLPLAAMTKSAQVPFSAWLPAAMAAPTPVSSLVHSSTLVTAGVYILIRVGELPELVHAFLLTIGILTSLIAGVSALLELDMKKIIALSTLSQLGVMFCALGFKSNEMAYCHLLAHAFFKAMLFITAGHLIHAFYSYQDFRMFGGGLLTLPFSASVALVAKLSLMGLPFFSACYTKEAILEAYTNGQLLTPLWKADLHSLGGIMAFYLAALLTSAYSARFLYLLFLVHPMSSAPMVFQDPDLKTRSSILLLFVPALVGGWLLAPYFMVHSIAPLVSPTFKILFLVAALSASVFGISLEVFKPSSFSKSPFLINLLAMPGFSASLPTQLFKLSGDHQLKFFSQMTLDSVFNLSALTSASLFAPPSNFFSSSIFSAIFMVTLWATLFFIIYLRILTSLKIQNFMC